MKCIHSNKDELNEFFPENIFLCELMVAHSGSIDPLWVNTRSSISRSLNSHLLFLMVFTKNGASWTLYSTNDA